MSKTRTASSQPPTTSTKSAIDRGTSGRAPSAASQPVRAGAPLAPSESSTLLTGLPSPKGLGVLQRRGRGPVFPPWGGPARSCVERSQRLEVAADRRHVVPERLRVDDLQRPRARQVDRD